MLSGEFGGSRRDLQFGREIFAVAVSLMHHLNRRLSRAMNFATSSVEAALKSMAAGANRTRFMNAEHDRELVTTTRARCVLRTEGAVNSGLVRDCQIVFALSDDGVLHDVVAASCSCHDRVLPLRVTHPF